MVKRTDRNGDKDEVLKQTELSSWPLAHDEKCKQENADLQEQEKSLKGMSCRSSVARVTGDVARELVIMTGILFLN